MATILGRSVAHLRISQRGGVVVRHEERIVMRTAVESLRRHLVTGGVEARLEEVRGYHAADDGDALGGQRPPRLIHVYRPDARLDRRRRITLHA